MYNLLMYFWPTVGMSEFTLRRSYIPVYHRASILIYGVWEESCAPLLVKFRHTLCCSGSKPRHMKAEDSKFEAYLGLTVPGF